MQVVLAFVCRDVICLTVDNKSRALRSVRGSSDDRTVAHRVIHILIETSAALDDILCLAVLTGDRQVGDRSRITYYGCLKAFDRALDGELLCLDAGI